MKLFLLTIFVISGIWLSGCASVDRIDRIEDNYNALRWRVACLERVQDSLLHPGKYNHAGYPWEMGR